MTSLDWLMIGGSYVTPPRDAQLTGLTYATVTAERQRATRSSWNRRDVISAGVVRVLMAAAYLISTADSS